MIEIDREPAPEGRLAVAESPVVEAHQAHEAVQHHNGAVDLIESMLCVPENAIDAFTQRYERYLGRAARTEGASRVFDLRQSCVRLVTEGGLAERLPGEAPPALPAFVAYAIAVRDLAATRAWLEHNQVEMRAEPSGGIVVPASAALGAAVIFRSA